MEQIIRCKSCCRSWGKRRKTFALFLKAAFVDITDYKICGKFHEYQVQDIFIVNFSPSIGFPVSLEIEGTSNRLEPANDLALNSSLTLSATLIDS